MVIVWARQRWWLGPAILALIVAVGLAFCRDILIWAAMSTLACYAILCYTLIAAAIFDDLQLPGRPLLWSAGLGCTFGVSLAAALLSAEIDLTEPALYVTSVGFGAAIAGERDRLFAHLGNLVGGIGLALAIAALVSVPEHHDYAAGAAGAALVVIWAVALLRQR